MKMKIKNADIVYPAHLLSGKSNRLFLSCGGRSNRSILAGQEVCEAIQIYFDSFLEGKITVDFIEKAIRMAEIRLSEFQKKHHEQQGFFTSLSLFYLADDCVYLAQIGESSICQIRENQVIMKMIDASIDRKLCGVHKPVEINVVSLKDIRANDCFFICNNIYLSSEDEQAIMLIIAEFPQMEDYMAHIKQYFLNRYKQTFSGHLIPIEQIHEPRTIKQWMDSLVYSFI
ncbi:MAG: hypothetical protein LBS25_02455 [Candidatus Symbiothrix sp.]|jgi:hypothetical protein|nr:hypothetical protein [Candidatus Symbiothrix sp.]